MEAQRLLSTSFSKGAFEVSRPGDRSSRDRPSLLATAGALVALLLVCLCTAWLVFGPAGGGSSSGGTVAQLPAACRELASGPLYDSLSPVSYNLTLRLPPALFRVDFSDPGTLLGSPPGFNASVAIELSIHQPTGCVLLHASGMRFWRARLVMGSESSTIGSGGGSGGSAAAAAGASGSGEGRELCGSTQECAGVIVPVTGRPQQSTLDQELVAIDLGGVELQPGSKAVLHLSYTGSLGIDGEGLYRSDPFVVCEGKAGEVPSSSAEGGGSGGEGEGNCRASALLVTQLEPTAARRLLPCLDGPRFKARFGVSLEVPSGLVALSNMPLAQRGPSPLALSNGSSGMDLVVFEPTPVMSPYLLAVAVGELEQLEAGIGESGGAGAASAPGMAPEVRLWAVPGKVQQLRVAQTAAAGALHFFSNWTGIAQPLSKFDFVAVPGKGGAMENWGLLLFDEARFLVNEGTEGAYGAWLAADVVCHEVAHQWFGNLVTAADWTQLTLNEGVASFAEYKCLAAVFPYMPAPPLFFRATTPSAEGLGIHEGPTQRALGHDGDPLLQPLVPPSDLEGSDGVVIYSKGASLLRMLEVAFESHQPGALQAGFQAFLRRHMYGTATMADLFAALADRVEGSTNSSSGSSGSNVGAGSLTAPASRSSASTFATLARQYSFQYTQLMGSGSNSSSGANAALVAANSLAAWLHQPGFPFLNLTLWQQEGPSNSVAAAVQQRLYRSWEQAAEAAGAANTAGAHLAAPEVRWWLPLSEPAASGLVSNQTGSPLMVMDPLGAGLYRTAYSEAHLAALLGAISALAPCYLPNSATPTSGQYSGSAGGSAAVPIGSNSCGGLGANASCQLDGAPLLAAAAVVADVAALASDGIYPASRVLRAAQAAALAPASMTGTGAYLLLLPAAEAVFGLRPMAAANSSQCLQALDTFAAKLLAPHAASALQGVPIPSAGAQQAQQDPFLGQLAASRLSWHAALAGDAAMSAMLCSALPATLLWRHIAGALAEAEDSGSSPLGCPPGFQPTNSSSSSSASGGGKGLLCQRTSTEGVPRGLAGGEGGGPSPDLLPAVYVAAAAGVPGCTAALGEPLGAAAAAVTPGRVGQALARCWEQEEDEAEANRCLHALPFLGERATLEESLAWLLDYASGAPGSNCSAATGSDGGLALVARAASRRRAARGKLPVLVGAAAQQDWWGTFDRLAARWQRGAECGLLSTLCSTLEQFPAPCSAEDYSQLEAFVLGPAGQSCPTAARARVLGRARQRQQAAGAVAAELCAAVLMP